MRAFAGQPMARAAPDPGAITSRTNSLTFCAVIVGTDVTQPTRTVLIIIIHFIKLYTFVCAHRVSYRRCRRPAT